MADALKKDDFLRFQVDAVDYLYDLPIANDSLFIADVHSPNDSLLVSKFRASSVSFAPPKFTFKRDEQRRMSFLESIQYTDTVTIEWIEDAFDSVQKWTLYLMSKKINFSNGLFRVGGSAAMHYDLDLYKFAYVEGNESATNPMDSVALPTCVSVLTLTDLEPEGIENISANSSSGGDVKKITVTYHVSSAKLTNLGDAKTMYNESDFFGQGGDLMLL